MRSHCKAGITSTDPYDYAGDLVTFATTNSDNGTVNLWVAWRPARALFSALKAPRGLVGPIVVGSRDPRARDLRPARYGWSAAFWCFEAPKARLGDSSGSSEVNLTPGQS